MRWTDAELDELAKQERRHQRQDGGWLVLAFLGLVYVLVMWAIHLGVF